MAISLQPQNPLPPPLADSLSSGTMLLRLSVTLLLVLVLVLFLGWLARRRGWGTGMAKGKNALCVGQIHSLGQRERVIVVEIDTRRFLLGVTPGSITLLCELDKRSDESEPSQGAFQQALSQVQGNKHRGVKSWVSG